MKARDERKNLIVEPPAPTPTVVITVVPDTDFATAACPANTG